jgi:hypothetical protein
MPLQATSGAASYDGFGGGVVAEPNYIESCFSTYVYTNDIYPSNLTITNGIDLSGKGGLVWMKNRSLVRNHNLYDTARGALKQLRSDSTGAEITRASGYGLTAFNANGFSLGTDIDGENVSNVASWTFRKQPKFFDVVTWTGTGAATQTISHNLGSAPGCIIAKSTSAADSWFVYHRASSGTPLQDYLRLNLTNGVGNAGADVWGSTSTTITVDANLNQTTSGRTYVAYLFAHDAGGFGLTGTDNVISCGSFVTDGSGYGTANLGWEPQWFMVKNTSGAGDWFILDSMRGFSIGQEVSTNSKWLKANVSDAETASYGAGLTSTTSTGLLFGGSASSTYIYIAIRRGPMKVPVSGSSVFAPVTDTGTSAAKSISAGLTVDAGIRMDRQKLAWSPNTIYDRLQGASVYMNTTGTAGNNDFTPFFTSFDQNGITLTNSGFNSNTTDYINYFFKRAPSVFDVVCYTGTGANTTQTHNLGVVPELIIVKRRNALTDWDTYSSALANTEYLVVNTTAAKATGATRWNSTTPTSSVFSVGTSTTTNASAATYVAYLFATCAGVSKVGSYTGTATTLQIDCGFTGGARFVLIKRTDSTGAWYVWDTARGIIAGNDSYLLLNSTAAEVTNTDYIDTYSAGFEISSTAPAAINASGGSFIFFAVA